jgi:hypothetical protein
MPVDESKVQTPRQKWPGSADAPPARSQEYESVAHQQPNESMTSGESVAFPPGQPTRGRTN